MKELEARIEASRSALARLRRVEAGRLRTVVAPYRVCPIGAHVDHQHGPVLGLAIGAWTLLSFGPSADSTCRITSENFPGEARFDLAALLRAEAAPGAHVGRKAALASEGRFPSAPPPRSVHGESVQRDGHGAESAEPRVRASSQPSEARKDWTRYAWAAARALVPRLPARPRGIVAHLEGSLPGGGLSSSASMLLALLTALAAANELALEPRELVSLSRRAENAFVGVASGVLDPAAIVGARRGHLLAIDTARLAWEAVPLGAGAPAHRILVAFSGTSRSLAATDFNQRVAECGAAARRLGELAGTPARLLGDLPDAAFEAHLARLPDPLRGRARHFAGERRRVREGAGCWQRGDLARFGELMNESSRSSVANYETGSPVQQQLQEILADTPGVWGARFSGGGYGGCCIALVDAGAAETCRSRAERAFAARFPELADRARFVLVDSEDGVRLS